jgi:hypothetical protein
MTRYTIYKHSKTVLIFSFWAWLFSNLIFGITFGFDTEPTNAENAIDKVLSLFMNLSAIVLFATIFNKLDDEMKADETHKTE